VWLTPHLRDPQPEGERERERERETDRQTDKIVIMSRSAYPGTRMSPKIVP